MAIDQPLQDVVHHGDDLHDPKLWAKQQVLRIEALPKQQVLSELQAIMKGHTYSWHCINELLQARFDEGSLEFSLVDGDVLFEWNNLCHQKRVWENRGRLSANDAEFNMDCLINLKILPVQAGLGIDVPLLVASNMDKPNVSTADLWVGPKDPESLKIFTTSRFLTDDDTSSSESEDSDYVDEYEETEDESVERKGVKIMDFDDEEISDNESDEERTEDEDIKDLYLDVDDENVSEDGSDKEESEDSGDSSDDSDEVETEDEDVAGLGVKIVDIDDEDEISDLEL